jgi:5-(carboxyamino)imidazole ribonucleotide mutase
MGSTSDWPTMEHAALTLQSLGIPYENRVVSFVPMQRRPSPAD